MDRWDMAVLVGAVLICAGVWMRWGLASAGLAFMVLGWSLVGLAGVNAWRHRGGR